MSLAREAGVSAEDAVVVHNSNKLAVRIRPSDVLARVAVAGQHVAGLEVAIASTVAARGAPVARLDPRLERRVYHRDRFAVTFWTYYHAQRSGPSPASYADALHRLHAGMWGLDLDVPDFRERIAEAHQVVVDRDASPELTGADRALLARTLSETGTAIGRRASPNQLLHGEPHPGNVLNIASGPVFIDFETCCRGPVEFDAAHVPEKVAARYPALDVQLLGECRRLVLAMVAAWRWQIGDEFPDGRRHGQAILAILRGGPPWPTLGALDPG